jgi:hypothetical protein
MFEFSSWIAGHNNASSTGQFWGKEKVMVASDSLSLNMSCQALDCKKDFAHSNLEGFKRMRVEKKSHGFGIFLGSFLEKKS